jgi:hypothetical protein
MNTKTRHASQRACVPVCTGNPLNRAHTTHTDKDLRPQHILNPQPNDLFFLWPESTLSRHPSKRTPVCTPVRTTYRHI